MSTKEIRSGKIMDTTENNLTPEEAAKQYVESHTDLEVRRMYGHHYRSFLAGTQYADKQKKDLLEVLQKIKGICIKVDSGEIQRTDEISSLIGSEINNVL